MLPASAIDCPGGNCEGVRGGDAGAGIVGRGVGCQEGEDGGGGLGGEEQADGAVEVRGEFVEVGKVGGGGVGAEGFGHDFGFAEEDTGEKIDGSVV